MADRNNKVKENVPGKYYVDSSCCDCGACYALAPEHFTRNAAGLIYVSRQPATPEEEKLCTEAMEGCPTMAIGDDGNVME